MTSSFAVSNKDHEKVVAQWELEYRIPESKGSSVLSAQAQFSQICSALKGIVSPGKTAVPFSRVRTVQGGVLLHGPPGCGKTHLVQAAAGELGLPLFVAQPAHAVGVYFGETGRALTSLFEAGQRVAAKGKGAVLFLDELEAYGRRSANPDAIAYNMMMANVLKLIDLASAAEGGNRLAIVGATNMPDACDPALLSRMSTRLEIPIPDSISRRAFFEGNIADARAAGFDIDPQNRMEALVSATDGLSTRALSQLLDAVNALVLSGDGAASLGRMDLLDALTIVVEAKGSTEADRRLREGFGGYT